MHYLYDDVARLLLHVPSLRLNRPASAQSWLTDVVEAGAELAHMLRDYPRVRYEPLDFHYVCRQSLSALNDALLADLTRHFGWRGRHWAALLAALSGDARYLPHLEAARHDAAVSWVTALAEAALNPAAALAASPCCQLIVRLREQIAPLPRVAVRLRANPSPEEWAATAAAVRAAYRNGDVDAARAIARRLDVW
ncbi:hypothetical protein WL30_15820 [Burkholderia ubonensis]|uniref:hypothetical protein n=1 Tax=Burkholderia ubonensis TaxID=101571 RepID=UPI00075C1048|nr:hypothetical protein [Burkholderia ubonensis]KWA70176.1 hypothetical protein WL30_15820 [Burkholderia ubonensis]KWB20342.1 hypothetical protein WL31_08345 [Burkholderia ubonensis]